MLFAKEQWNKMQQTQSRETAKTAYFKRVADGLRRELDAVDTQLNKSLRDRHELLPARNHELEQRIAWLHKKRKDLQSRLCRSAFNIGRI